MTIQAEGEPSSDSRYCWYEIFEMDPMHTFSTENMAVGMYMSFPCEQPCADTIEHTIYRYEKSGNRWLWDSAKMVSMDDSCWEYSAVDMNASWNSRKGAWVIE